MNRKKLLLIDGNSMLFRAYFATAYGSGAALSTSSGIPTNAVFGFASMLQKALEKIGPDYVIVAFDHDKHNFRTEIYSDYKGTREKTPDNLVAQFPIVREYISSVHMRQYEQHGIEADDIIGSLAKQNPEYDINILTSDKDLLQLVDPNIKVWLMKKGITEMECMDIQAVYDRFQLTPLQIIDLKGLSGDPSDNIPGVRKVGDKTAIKLLNDYGSVEGVYEHINEIKGKLQENLIADEEVARMSKMLATIKIDADIDISIPDCTYDFNSDDAMAFYSRYEMRSFMTRTEPVQEKKKDIKGRQVSFLRKEDICSPCALYLDENSDSVVGVALACENGIWYLRWPEALKDRVFLDLLRNGSIIVYDVKKWHHLAMENCFEIGENVHDLMIMSFLIDAKIKTIKDLFVRYELDLSSLDTSSEQLDLFEEEILHVQPACQSAYALLSVRDRILDKLREYDMEDLYRDIELPLARVLADMEDCGVRCLPEVLDEIAAETQKKLDELEAEIYSLAGKKFNINSPKQLAEVLYDDLSLMKTTKRSTDAGVLKKLEHKHPIVPLILDYRKYAKINSTYAVGLKKYIAADGKIHTDFNQCITETGRLSSSNPNLQNISIRNEEASRIRKAFVPEEGCVFVGADYSQVELRILAHLADEEALIEAFKQGMDIHTKTAMDVFNIAEDEVTPLQRRQAKAINFGIDYGMSDFGLAERLEIPVWKAKQFIESYFAKYPNVRKFMDETIAACQRDGYVTTLLKRRREIPEINSTNYSLKEFGKRAAMNAPVQGSAADLIKIAMINVYDRLKAEKLNSRMILQIHDELILNVPENERDLVMKIVEEEMENAITLKVPLLAQAEYGYNWLEVK